MSTTNDLDLARDVPRILISTLFRHPEALREVLGDAALPPHILAIWARQTGGASEVEKLAGWLAVGERQGHYKPLLEVAASHLRAGDTMEALPVFRWAYHTWRTSTPPRAAHRRDGLKLLALWGECLFRLGEHREAERRWLPALSLVAGEDDMVYLARVIERTGSTEEYRTVIEAAVRQRLPGAGSQDRRRERIMTATLDAEARSPLMEQEGRPGRGPGIAVLADVANLDMVCRDQYGQDRRPDYGHLLQLARSAGTVRVKSAYVPDLPETLAVRQHLAAEGFAVDLLQPKRQRGRWVANADTAMASFAVRWASDPLIGCIEMWTGDGDFLRTRDAIREAWPQVRVVFRSFEHGTAAGIRQLAEDWQPVTAQCLH